MVLMKAPLLCVLLCLLWSLVEVQSQTEYPYLTFRGNNLPNHSYVDITEVGNVQSGDTVQCHTDLSTCCSDSQELPPGDWFTPNNTKLDRRGDIRQDRNAQVVHLERRNNANSPTGIYRCFIATNATHNDSDGSVGKTLYVGLYDSGEGVRDNPVMLYSSQYYISSPSGDITISDDIIFTVDSDLNGATPQFTLTYISTGGPATTVTWTRDSVTVTEDTETVLDNRTTSQYTHTLTVTGRLGGLYTCTVANNKPSDDSASYTVQGKYSTI